MRTLFDKFRLALRKFLQFSLVDNSQVVLQNAISRIETGESMSEAEKWCNSKGLTLVRRPPTDEEMREMGLM